MNSIEKTEQAARTAQSRVDAWQNLFTGLGVEGIDRTLSTTLFSNRSSDERAEHQILFTEDGISKRIVTVQTGSMLREWFKVEGDTEDYAQEYFKRLKLRLNLQRGLDWAMVFGGSLGVMLIDDGGEFDTELREDNINTIERIRFYDRYRVSVESYYIDENDPKFGLPEVYRVSPVLAPGLSAPQFSVHETRTIRFDGIDVPDDIRSANSSWGDSIYTAIKRELSEFNMSFSAVARILDEFNIGTLKMENLGDLLMTGNEAVVRNRLRFLDQSRSTFRSMVVGDNEEYKRESATVTNMADLLDKIVQRLSAVTGIPVTLLMGQSPAGLNATGDNDVRSFYDKIAAEQEMRLTEALDRLTYLVMLAKDSGFGGTPIEDWKITYNKLWQASDKEVSETRLNTAKMDEIYLNHSVIEPEEVTQSRFGGEEYSMETDLMVERSLDEGVFNAREEQKTQAQDGNGPQLQSGTSEDGSRTN